MDNAVFNYDVIVIIPVIINSVRDLMPVNIKLTFPWAPTKMCIRDSAWTITRGPAGAFGKTFFNYVCSNPELGIRFKDMGKYGRRAVYVYKKEADL